MNTNNNTHDFFSADLTDNLKAGLTKAGQPHDSENDFMVDSKNNSKNNLKENFKNNCGHTLAAVSVKKNNHRKRRHFSDKFPAKKAFITAVLAVFMIAAISIYGIIIVNASVSADSADSGKSQSQRFYTSITVKPDDTLWDIADLYATEGESRIHYINTVKELNNMTDDTIYSGQNILIYYTK